MRIENSTIRMSSKSSSSINYTKEESLKTWVGDERPDFEGRKLSAEQLSNIHIDIVELSDQAKALLAREEGTTGVSRANKTETFDISERDKQKIHLIERMIEALTGKRIKIHVLKKIEFNGEEPGFRTNSEKPVSQAPQRQGWGLEYDYHESYYEQEKMSFAAQGAIKTADGREINFSVQLNMSREFASQQNIRIRAGDAAIDPLVFNFNGKAPELTDTKFTFDLDSDGKEDQISFVGPDSGFLALDLNGDGRINNGKELFGPNTGNGFAELTQYDEDGNQWIDENDSIYERLRIWTKDAEGKDVLFALGQKGIGAIYLGNIETSFAMKNQQNDLQGQVRKSGIYMNETGSVGTVQQIDLTI